MDNDQLPPLTRDSIIDALLNDWHPITAADAAILVDAYTARVIAEHRDTEQGCCHCGIPGRHYASDHKTEPPAERERPYWVPFDPNATQA